MAGNKRVGGSTMKLRRLLAVAMFFVALTVATAGMSFAGDIQPASPDYYPLGLPYYTGA